MLALTEITEGTERERAKNPGRPGPPLLRVNRVSVRRQGKRSHALVLLEALLLGMAASVIGPWVPLGLQQARARR